MPNLKLSLKDGYNFVEELKDQLGPNYQSHSINLDGLGAFGAGFTREASNYLDSLKSTQDKRRLNSFFKQLYQLF
jgi:hypothetical protein